MTPQTHMLESHPEIEILEIINAKPFDGLYVYIRKGTSPFDGWDGGQTTHTRRGRDAAANRRYLDDGTPVNTEKFHTGPDWPRLVPRLAFDLSKPIEAISDKSGFVYSYKIVGIAVEAEPGTRTLVDLHTGRVLPGQQGTALQFRNVQPVRQQTVDVMVAGKNERVVFTMVNNTVTSVELES